MEIKEIIQKNQGYNSNNLNVPKSLKATAQKLCFEYNQTGPERLKSVEGFLKTYLENVLI